MRFLMGLSLAMFETLETHQVSQWDIHIDEPPRRYWPCHPMNRNSFTVTVREEEEEVVVASPANQAIPLTSSVPVSRPTTAITLAVDRALSIYQKHQTLLIHHGTTPYCRKRKGAKMASDRSMIPTNPENAKVKGTRSLASNGVAKSHPPPRSSVPSSTLLVPTCMQNLRKCRSVGFRSIDRTRLGPIQKRELSWLRTFTLAVMEPRQQVQSWIPFS